MSMSIAHRNRIVGDAYIQRLYSYSVFGENKLYQPELIEFSVLMETTSPMAV